MLACESKKAIILPAGLGLLANNRHRECLSLSRSFSRAWTLGSGSASPQGNIMAIYDRSNNAEKLLNVYLYGSARVGEVLLNRDSVFTSPLDAHMLDKVMEGVEQNPQYNQIKNGN